MKQMPLSLVVGLLALAGSACAVQAQVYRADPFVFGGGNTWQADALTVFHIDTIPSTTGYVDVSIGLHTGGPGIYPPFPAPPAPGIDYFVPITAEVGIDTHDGTGPHAYTSATVVTRIHWSHDDEEPKEMVLSGGDLPIGWMIRESPTLVSTGQTSVQYRETDFLYRIDSFFDIFFELSIDGGATWHPQVNIDPVRLDLVPAPGAAGLLGLGGVMAARRRRG